MEHFIQVIVILNFFSLLS